MNPIIKTSRRGISAFLSIFMLASVLQFSSFANAPLASAAAGDPGSVCFDNSSTASYINLNNSNNAVGTGNFTLEMWAKLASGTPVSALVNGHSVNNGANTLSIFTDGNPGQGNSSINTIGSITKPGSIPANTWVHVAYVRTGGLGVWYVNGVPKTYNNADLTSVTDNNNYTSTNFRVGYPLTTTWPAGFTGCLAGVALTKSALYSSNFSANLPYPGTRVMPADSVIFLKPTAGGFSNTGTGAAPVLTGSVTFNSDLPDGRISQAITFTSTAPVSATYGSTYTPTATGGASGNPVTFTIDSTATSVCTISAGVVTVTGAGTCKVNADQASSANYLAAQAQQTFTVAKAAQATFTASQVTSSATWNGSAFTATPSFSTTGGSDTGAVTYGVTNGTATGCALSNATASAVLTATTAGTCTITATKAATTNYNAATSTLTFTFSQITTTSTLAISNSSVTYGSAVTLTASVLPSTATGTFSFSNNGTPISGCTSVAITSGIATCTTWKPGVGTYTPLTATYSGATNVVASTSSNSISLQITQATLTVTASSPTVIYGAAIPEVTPSYSGFVNSETSAVVTGLSCSTVYTTTSAVGSLPATSCSGGSASNYSISYVSGAVTINKSTPTISLALPASATTATYGTAVTITATVSKPGTVTFKVGGVVISGCTSIAATTTATCSWTPSAVNATTALTADFTPTDSTNYANLTAAGSRAINVGKASLSITASSHTVAFGSAIPTISPIYSGLVNGDSSAVVTGLTCTTTYTTSTSVGTTGSSCSGGSATNYTISYTSGVITITQGGQTSALVVTSTTATYESTLSLVTSGGNGAGSNSFVVDSGPCTVLGSTLTPTGAGICMVTATKAASGNYLAASSTSTAITVGKATPTFTWNGITKTYGAASFSLTTPTSSTPGDWTYSSGTTSVASVSGSTATVAGYGSSLVTAIFTPTDSTNYLSGGTTTMTILVNKASLGITASSHTVAYGDAVPTITPIYSGFVNGEDSTVISGIACSTVYTTTTAVGSVASSCSGATANNYSFAYTAGVITISQGGQTRTLTIDSTSLTYGSTLALTTLGGNGSGTNSFVVDSGPCTISGATLTPTGAGACMVTATKAASGNYLAASSSSTAITVNTKGLTISGLSGVNKEFDRSPIGTVTGTPTLVGVVGTDNVLLGGTPTFIFASANVADGITVTASGYTLTGTTASNYTLTQPTVTANITAKAVRVAATNTTIAFGAPIISGVTASGLISPDAIGSASYIYTGTGTSTPPTAVGVYTVTPSNAVLSTGTIGNYTISYDTATLTILAKYTVTLNANGGIVLSGATSNVDFVVGDNALTLPTPTRANYTFTGWHTLQTNGIQVTGAYTPTASATLWAHWVQNSLYGMGANTKLFSLTTYTGAGNTYSVSAAGGTVGIEYLADALPAGTVIDGYLLIDTSSATTLIGANNNYVMSLVLAWVALDGTVPTTAANKAIIMTITNSAIKKGSKIYSVIGSTVTPLGVAASDGSAVISITDDPQIIIAITKPDAPTAVSATSGSNAVSTVSWTAPANDGGSVVTSYTAVSNAGQSCTTSTTSCQINGLTNGTSYTFTVTALNAIGASDASAVSAAILTEDTAALALAAQQAATALAAQQAATALAAQQAATALAAQQAAATLAAQQAAAALAAQQAATALAAQQAATALAAEKVAADAKAAAELKATQDRIAAEAAEKAAADAKVVAEKVAADAKAAAELKATQDRIAAEAAEKAAADAKVVAEKVAADAKAAAELKATQDRIAAEAAEAAAIKAAQEIADAQAKAAAELKAAQDKAAEDLRIAEELRVAQAKADADLKAAAEKKALADAAAAALLATKKITPKVTVYSVSSTLKLGAYDSAYLKKYVSQLASNAKVTCVGYIYSKNTTYAKAKALAQSQAKAVCSLMKAQKKTITTTTVLYPASKAPKAAAGSKYVAVSYRVDSFKK